jgi:hypothetical protein
MREYANLRGGKKGSNMEDRRGGKKERVKNVEEKRRRQRKG